MNIKLSKPIARDLSDVLNQRPEQNIILRCVDCQTFLLPEEIHAVKLQFRGDDGYAHSESWPVCPACFPRTDKIGSWEDIPQSHFIHLTRFQYEQTRKAEQWGLTYDPKTDQMGSNLLIRN